MRHLFGGGAYFEGGTLSSKNGIVESYLPFYPIKTHMVIKDLPVRSLSIDNFIRQQFGMPGLCFSNLTVPWHPHCDRSCYF